MTEPVTTNVALIVPNTGDLPGTWGSAALNPDLSAIDGLLGGVQTISLSNANVTLTAPAGSITPSGGPTQSNNAVLKLTGALTGNVQITFPLPGSMIIDNQTTGNFVTTFAAAGSGQVISTPQGSIVKIYNDGTNARFVNGISSNPGNQEFWAGVSALPSWITACTVQPYLLCDGSVYNFTAYPALAARLLGTFGGNGVTTFGMPDYRGRYPLAYDGTGTRITTAGCGINGQTLGASGGNQNFTLQRSDLPNIAATLNGIQQTVSTNQSGVPFGCVNQTINTGSQIFAPQSATGATYGALSVTFTPTGSVNLNGNVTQTTPSNIPPTQVGGIWVLKT